MPTANKEKVAYQVGEEVVETLAEVAALLGVSKVTTKDISEGGKYADKVNTILASDEEDTEDIDPEDMEDEDEEDKGSSEGFYTALGDEEIQSTPEEIKESLPEFESLDELKKFIKDIDTPTLEYFAKGLNLEWAPTHNKAIHRMRIAQAFHRYFFPELFKPKEDKKKKGKFGDFSTERLYEMVEERKLNVKRSGNEPIDRMRAIHALKTVGALAE